VSRARADAGVTLVELLAAASITALIAPVLAGAVVVGWRTTDQTVTSLSENRNRQLVVSLFTRDVQGAATVAVSGAACTSPGDSLLVRLGWSETPANGPAADREVSWVKSSGGRVERRSCDAGGPVSSSVSPAHDVVGTPSVVCKDSSGAVAACSAAAVVELQVTDARGSFTATGRRRSS
jgi:type II secretory pathway component PulJ